MADWDEDSARLRRNLTRILREVRDNAIRRARPAVEDARKWQANAFSGLNVENTRYVGRFRGEQGIEQTRVWVGAKQGVSPARVTRELAAFETRLRRVVAALDARYPSGGDVDIDGIAAVLDLAAWAHCEWVRIHPFANGNGRTARIWANSILMRYGLPPVVRLRPRPDEGYGGAAESAMDGDWQPTARVFRRLLMQALGD